MPTLYLAPKFSYSLAMSCVGLHVLAGIAVLTSDLTPWPQGGLLVFLVGALGYTYYCFFICSKRIIACWYRGHDWYLQLADYSIEKVQLLPQGYLSKLLTILQFEHEGHKKRVLILPYEALSNKQRIALCRELKLITLLERST